MAPRLGLVVRRGGAGGAAAVSIISMSFAMHNSRLRHWLRVSWQVTEICSPKAAMIRSHLTIDPLREAVKTVKVAFDETLLTC